jgi:ABC-2 type transport system permease protein
LIPPVIKAIYRVVERDLMAQLRSRAFFIQTLLLPMILTLIIGTALGSSRTLEPSPVALYAPDNEISKALETTLNSTGAAKIQRYASAALARAAVQSGRAIAMIELPEINFRALARPINAEDSLVIKLGLDPSNQIRGRLVEQVTRSYLAQLEAVRASLLGAVRALKPTTAQELGALSERLLPVVTKRLTSDGFNLVSQTSGGRSAGFFAYYAVAFGVMFTLMSATNGAGGILDEVERGTVMRLLSAPLTPRSLIVAKFFALMVMAVVQLGSFAVLTSFIYGVNWGEPWAVATTVLATAAAAAGFGGIIIGIAQSHEQVNVIGLGFLLVMSLLGGSMWPIETLPGLAQQFSRLTYNRWSIEAFQNLHAVGQGLSGIGLNLLVLFGMSLAGLAFGAARLEGRFKS